MKSSFQMDMITIMNHSVHSHSDRKFIQTIANLNSIQNSNPDTRISTYKME